MVKQSLTSLKLICVGSTHDNLQIIPLDQIQIRHGLIPIKVTKVYVLLREKTEKQIYCLNYFRAVNGPITEVVPAI